jgi:hypothetical protein
MRGKRRPAVRAPRRKETDMSRWSERRAFSGWSARALTLLPLLATVGEGQAADPAPGNGFIAFSLDEAENRLHRQDRDDPIPKSLAGITRPAGAIDDAERGDLIILGQVVPGEPALCLDDLVVALRARLLLDQWPEVSIERAPETTTTGMQAVRFEGGIRNTRFGRDLFEADLALKHLALGNQPLPIDGLPSYHAMRLEESKRSATTFTVSTRFWFYPRTYQPASRDGVFIPRDFRMGVSARSQDLGNAAKETGGPMNPAADRFAAGLSEKFAELCACRPVIARVQPLLRLVAIADGVKLLARSPDLSFWLKEYEVASVETPEKHPLLVRTSRVQLPGEDVLELEIDGGIQLKVLQTRLMADGDISAIKAIVLGARPKGSPLSWPVPMGHWRIPGYEAQGEASRPTSEETSQFEPGFSITESLRPLDKTGKGIPPKAADWRPAPFLRTEAFDRLCPQINGPSNGSGADSGLRGRLQGDLFEAGMALSRGGIWTSSLVMPSNPPRLPAVAASDASCRRLWEAWQVGLGRTNVESLNASIPHVVPWWRMSPGASEVSSGASGRRLGSGRGTLPSSVKPSVSIHGESIKSHGKDLFTGHMIETMKQGAYHSAVYPKKTLPWMPAPNIHEPSLRPTYSLSPSIPKIDPVPHIYIPPPSKLYNQMPSLPKIEPLPKFGSFGR